MLQNLFKFVRACAAVLAVSGVVAAARAQPAGAPPKSDSIRGEPIGRPRASATALPGASNAAPAASRLIAAKPAAPAKPAADPAKSPRVGGYLNIGFDTLASFDYDAPEPGVTNQAAKGDAMNRNIPEKIRLLDGEKVVVEGFMMPLKLEGTKTSEFVLMRNQATCCFGAAPMITEFITVKAPGKGVESVMDVPVNVSGTLHVGTIRENGYITQIYQMDGEKMAKSEN